tara:strand:+ start:1141 stop:1479 length:339 start_codon:yes stop_codon:yes gene_type:complete
MSEEKSVIEEVEEAIEVTVEEVAEDAKGGFLKKVKEKITPKKRDALYLDSKSKGLLDAFQEKLVSRKLLVFLTATGLLIGAGLDPDTWGMIAMFYIGGQSAIDAVQVWRHGK